MIMICTLASRLLGVVRISLISNIFGATGTADIINFTFNIPNNLRKMLAEGALSSAFIPVLSKAIVEDKANKTKRSSQLIQQMVTIQTMIFIPLGVLVLLFSEQIIQFLSAFDNEEMIHLSSLMLRYFMIYLFFISMIAIINSVLNCHNVFTIVAASPLCFSVAVISSLWFLSERFGAMSFIIGVIAGGILQFLVILPAYYHLGYRLSFTHSLSGEYIHQVLISWLPVIITSSIAIVNQQVAYFFASGLQEGSVTAFTNSIIFWQLPYGLFFNSVATVYFPRMSNSYHSKDLHTFTVQVGQGIERLLIFLLPSTILLISLRNELVASILYRGAYTLEDTILTARSVSMFSIGLVAIALYNFLLRLCYSANKFRVTIISSLIVTSVDIVLSILFVHNGSDVSYLALANSVSFVCGLIFLTIYTKKQTMIPLYPGKLLRRIGYLLLLNLPLLFIAVFYDTLKYDWWASGRIMHTFVMTTCLSLGYGGVTLIMYRLGHVEILTKKTAVKNHSR